jgi:hypothetical protein
LERRCRVDGGGDLSGGASIPDTAAPTGMPHLDKDIDGSL